MRRPQYSITALIAFVAFAAVGVAMYRHFNPPPVYPLPTLGGGLIYGSALNFQYEAEISDEAIQRALAWDRRQPNPPLSANAAMVRADQVRQRLIDEKQLFGRDRGGWWAITAAELRPYDEERGLWYWRVRFEYFLPRMEGQGNHLQLVVLMDGTVIEPVITSPPEHQVSTQE